MKKFLAGTAVCAIPIALLTVAAPAAAATSDGTLTVTVANDVNVNGTRDGLDTALANVRVRIVDSENAFVDAYTDAAGVATFAPSETVAGGQYRVEVTNPNAGVYTEAQILDGRGGSDFSPTVSFVDLSDGADVALNVGYVDVRTLGPDNAKLFSAVQPDDVFRSNSGATEAYTMRYDLLGAHTNLTTRSQMGSVYGLGLDTDNVDLYYGAYAKRGAYYGPGGSGAIYRVNGLTGDMEQYATVADAGDTVQPDDLSTATGHGYDFRTVVGRESLGDVAVTDDNAWLTTVNMHTDSLVVFPVQEELNPAPVQTLPIPAPGIVRERLGSDGARRQWRQPARRRGLR